jgi:hypothetical protein
MSERSISHELVKQIYRLANDIERDSLDRLSFKIGEILDDAAEEILKVAAKGKYKTWKGKGEKPPEGAEVKAPKKWWDKMVKDVKKKNPDYSKKRVSEIVGDIWDNELTDKKRREILKRY